MPYKSKAQMRYMYAKHPRIAKEWSKKYKKSKNLPEHVKKAGKFFKQANLFKIKNFLKMSPKPKLVGYEAFKAKLPKLKVGKIPNISQDAVKTWGL